jgi:hypothetical protein
MNLSGLNSKDWARIATLIEKKEKLKTQLGEIDRELDAFGADAPENGAASPRPRARRGRKPARRAARAAKPGKTGKTARGQLKESVIKELKSGGKEGVTVRDLVAKLGSTYGNITAFFQTTGKKIPEIKKVGPARFAWAG